MSPGTSGALGGGRADIKPVVRLFSFLLDKTRVPVCVELDDRVVELSHAVVMGVERRQSASTGSQAVASSSYLGEKIEVPLIQIAHGRSGDKGDDSNIGIVARSPEIWPWLQENLTVEKVAAHMAHLVKGEVERYELPGIMALNFVLHRALGGGGMASLQSDPLGKCYAQLLLDMPISIPKELFSK